MADDNVFVASNDNKNGSASTTAGAVKGTEKFSNMAEEKRDSLINRDVGYDAGKLPFEKSVYERNRILFLIQSALLGISYAIVWPTLWMYVKDFKELSLPAKKILYGTTFVAYPVSSMLAAHLVQKTTSFNTRILFMTLNLAEVVGSLIYALNFHPVCLFIGRFIAGIGDAFYVVIMQDVRITQSYKGGSVAAECLVAFIIGLVTAQILNIATFWLPFHLGAWVLNSYNYPGLIASILFCVMGIALRLFMVISDDDNETYRHPTNTGYDKITYDKDMWNSWGLRATFICVFSFVHTYIVSLMEILIPIFIVERVQATALSSILIYGFVALLYAMILMITMSINSPMMLEISLLISVLFKMLALLAATCLAMINLSVVNSLVAVVAMVVAITFMWSNEDVMYTNLILSLIPFRAREYANSSRKSTSKFAFILSGVTVPFLYSDAMLYVGAMLIVLVGILFGMFMLIRMFTRPSSKVM